MCYSEDPPLLYPLVLLIKFVERLGRELERVV